MSLSWEQRLAIRYYNRLYKEYALVDLTYYEINKIGMRWRTEREVIDGKGQFSCGNLHCDNTNTHDLCSYEVPFRYKDLEGKVVSTLVKVRLCGPCAYQNQRIVTCRLKLFYRKIRKTESEFPELRKKREACETSQDVFEYITSILKEEQIEQKAPDSLAFSKGISKNETKEISAPQTSIKRDASPIVEKQTKQKKQKQKKQKKPKTINGHMHYSSSSDSSSGEDSETNSGEDNTNRAGSEQKREIDADGNEVISTSNDVWKTSVEVEHTENENMDDFINQLFLLHVCSDII